MTVRMHTETGPVAACCFARFHLSIRYWHEFRRARAGQGARGRKGKGKEFRRWGDWRDFHAAHRGVSWRDAGRAVMVARPRRDEIRSRRLLAVMRAVSASQGV